MCRKNYPHWGFNPKTLPLRTRHCRWYLQFSREGKHKVRSQLDINDEDRRMTSLRCWRSHEVGVVQGVNIPCKFVQAPPPPGVVKWLGRVLGFENRNETELISHRAGVPGGNNTWRHRGIPRRAVTSLHRRRLARLCICFLSFILLFWNQILTCRSVRTSLCESSQRIGLVMYMFEM